MLLEALLCLSTVSSVAASCHTQVEQPKPVVIESIFTAKEDLIPSVWQELAICESGWYGEPRWDYNGNSGFDGGIQFHPQTWSAYKFPDSPDYAWQASPYEQIQVGKLVAADQGASAWPHCTSTLGITTQDLLS